MSCGFIRIETSDSFGLNLSSDELRIHSDWKFGFIRFETFCGWAADSFSLKLSSDELRIHSDWKFGFIWFKNIVRMRLIGFIRIETLDSFDLKLSSDELRIHSDWKFGFIRFETLFGWASDSFGIIRFETFFGWATNSFGLKLRIHSVWNKFYEWATDSFEFKVRIHSDRKLDSEWLGELPTGSKSISTRSFRQGIDRECVCSRTFFSIRINSAVLISAPSLLNCIRRFLTIFTKN